MPVKDTYELDPAHIPAKYPGCKGNSFRVIVEVEWHPSPVYRPCKLEWWEQSDITASELDVNKNLELFDEQMSKQEPKSATFNIWAAQMDERGVNWMGNAWVQHHRKIAERFAKFRRGRGPHPISLVDSPCYDGDRTNADGQRERTIVGHIKVKPGCPSGCGKSPVEANWAQNVGFDSIGDLDRVWFTQWPKNKDAKSPGATTLRRRGYRAWKRRRQSDFKKLRRASK